MAGKIRARDIEEVKSRVNIADVVSEYVSLKNASVGSLKGLCPFHDEKSPSFNVRPMQGFYHCFGCGEGGDVYKFLQQMDSISFYEAVEKLAARVGFELTYEDGGPAQDQGQRSRILEANAAAAAFYYKHARKARLAARRVVPGKEELVPAPAKAAKAEDAAGSDAEPEADPATPAAEGAARGEAPAMGSPGGVLPLLADGATDMATVPDAVPLAVTAPTVTE
jgi:DNA primase